MPASRSRPPIVCFANDWDGDPLSKTHLMRLAARSRQVLWVNSLGNRPPRTTARDLTRIGRKLMGALQGLRSVELGLTVLSPLALPWYGHKAVHALNARLLEWQVRRAMAQLHIESPVVVSYLPAAAPVVDRLGASLRIYHCVDDFGAFEGAGDPIIQLERQLVHKSDLIICSSEPLRETKARQHPRVALVRHGVDHTHFSKAVSPDTPVHVLVRDLPRPVLGFVGLLAEWVDVELMARLAQHYSSGTLVVVGRHDMDISALTALPNVVATGRLPYAELPSLLKGVDVALCPFKEDALAHAANPLKVREYLAAGVPVVSSPIPEVEQLGLCRVARGVGGFIQAIEAALEEDGGRSADRSATMRHESWEARWQEIERLIDETRNHVSRRATADMPPDEQAWRAMMH